MIEKPERPRKKVVNSTQKQWIYDDEGNEIGYFDVSSKSVNALSFNECHDADTKWLKEWLPDVEEWEQIVAKCMKEGKIGSMDIAIVISDRLEVK